MEPRRIQFGLMALSVAMTAKQGRHSTGDCLRLCVCALEHIPDDKQAVAAVLTFEATSRGDVVRAGTELHEFIIGWRRDPDEPPEFDWQKRADING